MNKLIFAVALSASVLTGCGTTTTTTKSTYEMLGGDQRYCNMATMTENGYKEVYGANAIERDSAKWRSRVDQIMDINKQAARYDKRSLGTCEQRWELVSALINMRSYEDPDVWTHPTHLPGGQVYQTTIRSWKSGDSSSHITRVR